MSAVLVVMEQRGDGKWHRVSVEALAAGQKLAAELGVACSAAVVGEAGGLVAELAASAGVDVWWVKHELLGTYSADGWVLALQQLMGEVKPGYVVFPHTYQVRDYAPALATRLGQVLISDVTAIGTGPVFTRQWMQGKLHAEYRHVGDGVCLVSVQAGSFQGREQGLGIREQGSCEVREFVPVIEVEEIRTRAGEPFREAAQTVDLSVAQVIVSVGRGIGEQENLAMGGGVGGGDGSGAGGLATDMRRGVVADGAASGKLRADGGAEGLSGGGDFGCDSALGGDEEGQDGDCDQ